MSLNRDSKYYNKLLEEFLQIIGEKYEKNIKQYYSNQIGSIPGIVDIIKKRVNKIKSKKTPDILKHLDQIKNDVKTLLKNQNQKSNKKYISIKEAIESVKKNIEIDPKLSNIFDKINILLSKPDYEVNNQVSDVIYEILKNAINAISDGGEITITSEVYKDENIINISDTGCKIPPDALDSIFQFGVSYWQGQEKKNGIGLWIARYIIKEIGNITVERKTNETIFKIILPVLEKDKKKQTIIRDMKNPIRILHLSDLHLKTDTDISSLLQPLYADLEDKTDGIGIDKIHYLVVTGDLTDRASKEEFKKAEEFCAKIKKEYHLKSENIIIVPGNHDLDWNEEVYDPKDANYPNRFKNYSEMHSSLVSNPYPLEFDEQCIPVYFNEHKIQFLAINSSWEIDKHNQERSGVKSDALSNGLLLAEEQIQEAVKKGNITDKNEVLRIVCWHHPITGNEKIQDDAFMESIQKADFKLCLHGHVHEERADLIGHTHQTRKVHVIGSGTFDAPDRPESNPRIYNLLEISENRRVVRVHTRCKKKIGGAWTGLALWQYDQFLKLCFYEIDL